MADTRERCCTCFRANRGRRAEEKRKHIHTPYTQWYVRWFAFLTHKQTIPNSSSNSRHNNGYSAQFDNSTRALLHKISIFIMSIICGTVCVVYILIYQVASFLFPENEGEEKKKAPRTNVNEEWIAHAIENRHQRNQKSFFPSLCQCQCKCACVSAAFCEYFPGHILAQFNVFILEIFSGDTLCTGLFFPGSRPR